MKNHDDMELFLKQIEERLDSGSQDRKPFAQFLEEKMDAYDYSNTSLARKVYHRIEKKGEGQAQFVPVTRQTIGSWLKGSMPSSREIYISLGMAFDMSLYEINYILLETYMGYGLYCKNIEDALWIAVINQLFDITEFEDKKNMTELILAEPDTEEIKPSLATLDLWEMLSQVKSMDQFYDIIRAYKEEFRDGTRRFGECLEEVIEEEYGYYEKATQLLRDIGLPHCEAQFSKIKAGKAVVTREWLLRFCIALQPTYESIEKLLAKAQMEPLGITPAEIILEMISKYRSDSLANSQEIWAMIETVTTALKKKGYEIDEDLCQKYNVAYEMTTPQKIWFLLSIGKKLLQCRKDKEYGYEKTGYSRYGMVDKILFDEVNKNKKSSAFKADAVAYAKNPTTDWDALSFPSLDVLTVSKTEPVDELDLEKFEEYCFMRKPSRFSKDFIMNDTYLYSALIYSVWSGRCFQKDYDEACEEELTAEFARLSLDGSKLLAILKSNLGEDSSYKEANDIGHIMEVLAQMCVAEV